MAGEFDFSGTAEDLTPSEGGNQPTIPYIGKAQLIDVNLEDPSKKEGKSFEVIQFHFKLLEGDQAGTVHRHIEWPPSNQSQASNTFKRIGHILSQFVAGDKEAAKEKAAKALASSSWDELRKKTDALFNKQLGKDKYTAKDDLKIKLIGSVQTQGRKAGSLNFGFPGYLGFITDSRSDTKLTFSVQEVQNNAIYLKALTSAPDNAAAKAGGSAEAPEVSLGEEGEEDEGPMLF